jgi:hypothetical protein
MEVEHHPKATRLRIEEYENFKLIDADRDKKITALRLAYKEIDKTKKTYNYRFIYDEMTFQEELLKIEEAALHRKIASITGNKPAEIKARASLNLEILELQQDHNEKMFNIEQAALKSYFDNQNKVLDNTFLQIELDQSMTDSEKSDERAKNYASHLNSYIRYMEQMNEFELKYNKSSKINQLERIHSKLELEKANIEATQQLEQEKIKEIYKTRMSALMAEKINATQAIIADGDMGPGEKKSAMEDVGRDYDKKAIEADQNRIETEATLNQQLYDNGIINATTYYDQLDSLRERNLNNAIKAYELEQEEANRNNELIRKGLEGGITIAQTIGSEFLAQEQKNAELQQQREQRAMDWNKRQLDSQVQSQQQQRANDVAFQQTQEQMAKRKADQDKKRAMEQMAMEYAVAAFRIVAANLWKGPEGWAEIAIEEGILAATYGLKLAFLSNAKTFGDGGEVPGSGGQFGGQAHGQGGTPFMFRGRSFEAEAGELAIINKRSSSNTGVFSFSGTPKQIASGLNALGGGVNFAPGWSGGKLPTLDYGGMLGAQLQMPDMIFRHSMAKDAAGSLGNMDDIKGSIAVLTANVAALTQNIGNVAAIPVQLDPHGLNAYNYNHLKSVKSGKI